MGCLKKRNVARIAKSRDSCEASEKQGRYSRKIPTDEGGAL